MVSSCRQRTRWHAGACGTYPVDADDLASGLLDLLEASQEVPVPGLGDHRVRGEDAHAVHARGRVGFGRQMSADDLVLLKTT